MALKKLISKVSTGLFLVVLTVSTSLLPLQATYADDTPSNQTTSPKCDYDYIEGNAINLYDPCAPACSASGSTVSAANIKNADYAGNPMFSTAELQAISENQPFYQKSADANGIPWQMLAAIHYRETRFKRSGPDNGQGPFQIVGSNSPTGDYSDDQFQAASDAAAAFVKNKVGAGTDYTNQDNVKKAFFAYNGTGKVYIDQAKALGFTDDQAANGEGSPYVMNRADAKRDPTVDPTKTNNTWGQIKSDGGSIEYPANSDFGAYTVYAVLAGIQGADGSCSIGGNGLTLDQANKFIDMYKAIDNGDPNNDAQYVNPAIVCYKKTDNCTALSVYFTNKYTDLKPASANGSKEVSTLVSLNPDIQVGNIPQPFSIFSSDISNTKCLNKDGSYTPCGHTGVVLGIDPDKDEIYTAEAAWCQPGYTNIYTHSLSQWSDASHYSYAYVGAKVNVNKLMSDIGAGSK
jgi:hypothetical protein